MKISLKILTASVLLAQAISTPAICAVKRTVIPRDKTEYAGGDFGNGPLECPAVLPDSGPEDADPVIALCREQEKMRRQDHISGQ